jgi:RNA polymerase sigma-70 factor (ECF subfamily)
VFFLSSSVDSAAAVTASPLAEEALALRDELYRFVAASARDAHAAEDIVQETLWRAHRQRNPVRNPRAWCFTVALNLLRSEFRRPRRIVRLGAVAERAGLDFAAEHALRDQVHRALRRVQPEQRTALLLQILGGFSCREIAEMAGISEPAVRQRLFRAREAFRRAFALEERA